MNTHRRRGPAILATAALSLSFLATTGPAQSAQSAQSAASASGAFDRVATYPVFHNVPAGVDPADPTVAEISAVSEDGLTVAYSDAEGKRVGFLDITDPSAPQGLGTLDLARAGHLDDQPTSVAIVGNHLLVVIDSSGGDFTNPSGRLDVYDLSARGATEPVQEIDLGGQPDSIAVSKDQAFAAIAMENQRDEQFTPPGGEEGDLPQAPAGFVQIIDLVDPAAPTTWTNREVALPAVALAGLSAPDDAEPEYVSINDDNTLALTLQENNGIVVIDLAEGSIDNVFTAGDATIDGIDVTEDGLFNPTGSITAPREPDAIGWIDDTHVATANEGDWRGGTRGWTIFDTTTGEVVWDAGNSFEKIATSLGLHNNDRAANKGAEPEGLTIATIGGKRRAFVGSERSNFVAVYDLTDPAGPVFEQALPATNGPEGLLAIPERDLFVVSSETDEAENGVRASVGVYAFGSKQPAFPSIVSAEQADGQPIGWGALGALSAAPGDRSTLWAASDAAYATGRIYRVDVSEHPAVIERVLEVTDASGAKPAIDIEGLHARAAGGFWAGVEGKTGAENALLRLDGRGAILDEIRLPADVAAQVGSWGIEGVTAVGSGKSEVVHVALQRPLEGNLARIGSYHVRTGAWTWFTYPLATTTVSGDWIGLSEITAIDSNTLAVIERDKLNGPDAQVKRVYTVDLPRKTRPGRVVRLNKRLAVDVLPAMRAHHGWTQEKLEGLTIGADGQVYAVTDNDGLLDATGETQFLRLGKASKVFAAKRGDRRGR